MVRTAYCLSNYVRSVLRKHSDKYPNKVVSPQLVSCFVLDESCGKSFYYPVNGLAKTERSDKEDSRYTYRRYVQDINIDGFTFCQNPIGVKSPITAADLLRFEGKVGGIDYMDWFCPQLQKDLRYPWNEEIEKEAVELLSEGILIFKTTER